MSLISIHAALRYNTIFCCDRHGDNVFDLDDFVPGSVFNSFANTAVKCKDPPTAHSKNCPVKQRHMLDDHLIKWLITTTQSDGSRAGCDILSDQNCSLLVRAPPNSLHSPSHITQLLDETAEWEKDWAALLLEVISMYDKQIVVVLSTSKLLVQKKVKTSH